MTCPHCQRLQARVAHLEKELGVRRKAGEVGAVMAAFSVTATQARLLLRLYAADGGQTVVNAELMDELSSPEATNLRVHVYNLRSILGDDAIRSVRGVGYGLSPPVASRIMAAIDPVELARVVLTA